MLRSRLRVTNIKGINSIPVFGWLILIIGLWMVVNVITCSRSPTVWMDEVMYTDPAANLALGAGFTSTAWSVQRYGDLWAGNVPLHPLLLSMWLRIVPFNPAGVRSLNYLLVSMAVILVWCASSHFPTLSPVSRLALCCLLLCGYGITFSYRSGRPDSLTILLAGAAWWLAVQRGSHVCLIGLFVVCALMPVAGIQMVPALFVVCLTLLLFFGRAVMPKAGFALVGCLLGALSLLLFYWWQGVLGSFLDSIRVHSAQGQQAAGFADFLLLKLRFLPGCYLDPSYLLVGIVFLGLLLRRVILIRNRYLFRAQITAAILAFLLPAALHLTGKYPIYYSWMGYTVASWGMVIEMVLASGSNSPRWLNLACITVLTAAILIGLPARLVLTLLEWKARDYSLVEEMVQSTITGDDWVYADFSAYYAVRRQATRVFLPTYASSGTLQSFRDLEAARISKLVINPESFSTVTNLLGGRWVSTGQTLDSSMSGNFRPLQRISAQKYVLGVFRRQD